MKPRPCIKAPYRPSHTEINAGQVVHCSECGTWHRVHGSRTTEQLAATTRASKRKARIRQARYNKV